MTSSLPSESPEHINYSNIAPKTQKTIPKVILKKVGEQSRWEAMQTNVPFEKAIPVPIKGIPSQQGSQVAIQRYTKQRNPSSTFVKMMVTGYQTGNLQQAETIRNSLSPEKLTRHQLTYGEIKKGSAETKNNDAIPEEISLRTSSEKDTLSTLTSSDSLRVLTSSTETENTSNSPPLSPSSSQENLSEILDDSSTSSKDTASNEVPTPISRRGSLNDDSETLTANTQTNIENTQTKVISSFLKTSFKKLLNKFETPHKKSMRELKKDLPSFLDIKNEDLANDIYKTIKVSSKTLQRGSILNFEHASLSKYNVLIQSDVSKRIELIRIDEKLGEGASGAAYKTISSSGKSEVLKIPKNTETGAKEKKAKTPEEKILDEIIGMKEELTPQKVEKTAEQLKYEKKELAEMKQRMENSLKNEEKITTILNKDGEEHEGVQGLTKISSFTRNAETKTATRTAFYSRGDFHRQTANLRLLRFLGVSADQLKSSDIEQIISQKIINSENYLKQKIKEKNEIKNNKDLRPAAKKNEADKINKEIEAEISNYIESMSIYEFFPKETAEKLKGVLYTDFIHALKYNSNFNPDEEIPKLCSKLNKTFLLVAKKNKSIEALDIKTRMTLGKNLLVGLRYIHSKGIVHGDIKPSNIFWGEKQNQKNKTVLHAVLADFGGAQVLKEKNPTIPDNTRNYSSGAVLHAINYYKGIKDKKNEELAAKALDMRALGVTLYQMHTGAPVPDEMELKKNFYEFDPVYKAMEAEMKKNTDIPPRAAELIAKMAKPAPFDNDKPPKTFPLPLTDDEYSELTSLLDFEEK